MHRYILRISALTVAAIALARPASAARYVFATFKGDRAPGEQLSIYESTDALNFTLVADSGFVGSSGTLRDPSIMKYRDGRYYVAHTNPPTESCCGRADHFSIASSVDLLHWTDLTTVAARVPGVDHTWAPEWFIDDGVVHIIASIDTLDNDTDFQPYLFTATNADLSAWSVPVPLGFGPNYIDTFVLKVGGVYHAFTKQETTRFLEHATAPTLTGPWTFIGVGNWSGFGSGMEGPSLVRLDDGSWRMFLDGQGSVGFLYAESTDLFTWSGVRPLPGLTDLVRHGTIILDAVNDSLVNESSGNSGPAPIGAGFPAEESAGDDAGPAAGSAHDLAAELAHPGVMYGDRGSEQTGEASSGAGPVGGVRSNPGGGAAGAIDSSARSGDGIDSAQHVATNHGCHLAAPDSPWNPCSWAGLLVCAPVLLRRAARYASQREAS
jgi:Glycosyl hydrolases family 43